MTKRIGNITIIEAEPDGKCAYCGKMDELRPYGKKGEQICFDCGMKDEKTTARMMNRNMYGECVCTKKLSKCDNICMF